MPAFTHTVLHLSQQAKLTQGHTLTATVVYTQVGLANTMASRLVGLLRHTHLQPEQGLWITPCHSIHSVGMRFAFDAAFIDAHGKVLHRVEAMRSLRLSPIVKGAVAVLEVPAHSLAKHGITEGDTLVLL